MDASLFSTSAAAGVAASRSLNHTGEKIDDEMTIQLTAEYRLC
jgi:hypothetical protein